MGVGVGVPESCWEGECGVSVGRGGQTCGEKQADRKEISCSFHAGRGDSSGPERCPDTRNTQSQKALPTSASKSLPSNYHLRQTGPLLEPRTTWDQLVHDTEMPSSSDSGNVTKPTKPRPWHKLESPETQNRALVTTPTPAHLLGWDRSSQRALQGKGQETTGLLFPAWLPLRPSKSACAASGQPEPRIKRRRPRTNTIPPRLSIPSKDQLGRCVILVKEQTTYVKAQ